MDPVVGVTALTVDVTANLLPALGDFDLGDPRGPPIPALTFPDAVGAAAPEFDVIVRANVGEALVVAVDAFVKFDPLLLNPCRVPLRVQTN